MTLQSVELEKRLSTLSPQQRGLWEELDRFAYAWNEGEQAAASGLGPRDCPHPWAPGRNTPYLRWMEGLVRYHACRIGRRDFDLRRCDAALRWLNRANRDAAAVSVLEITIIRLLRMIFLRHRSKHPC